MYALGIDLGTTYTAAATWRDGRVEIASLGSRGAAIPSVVLLREDETLLTGETANRRALTEPHRVAREFKRRLGDTTPILLGGAPYSAEALMARLLRWVVDEVATREGEEPSAISVCHPANWGPYKLDLLRQAARMSNIEQPVTFTTEPEAAAVFYAHGRRVEPGALVAVYDLGGGTFDAAVLRKTEAGFAILGQPEGIERLGGIDFDAAVFNHVNRVIGDRLAELDEDDPAAIAAVARLRDECVEAKEALSSDTDVAIPVLLPNLSTEVRLTRTELEAMVRPALYESIEALRRALRSAGVTPEQLDAVLLVGGSSRMPIVSQLVGAELGRPVAVDAHPKHAIALGAAWIASGAQGEPAEEEVAAAPVVPPSEPPVQPAPASDAPRPEYDEPEAARTTIMRAVADDHPKPTPPKLVETIQAPSNGSGRRSRTPLLIGGGALAAAVAAFVLVPLFNGDDENQGGGTNDPALVGATSPAATAGNEPTSSSTTEPPEGPGATCTDEILGNKRWVCLTSAKISGGEFIVEYDAEWAGSTPDINGGFHVHFYGADETGENPPAAIMGTQESRAGRGDWYIEDQEPSVLATDSDTFRDVIGDAAQVCGRVANGDHELVPDADGNFETGNCVPIDRE